VLGWSTLLLFVRFDANETIAEKTILNTIWAEMRGGRVELLEPADLPEGAKLLVTVLADEEAEFWKRASQKSLDAVWDHPEDDAYAELLKT
jgi:hypothetical protein